MGTNGYPITLDPKARERLVEAARQWLATRTIRRRATPPRPVFTWALDAGTNSKFEYLVNQLTWEEPHTDSYIGLLEEIWTLPGYPRGAVDAAKKGLRPHIRRVLAHKTILS